MRLPGKEGHSKLVRESRGDGDQLHRDKTQASATGMDQLRCARVEWAVTMAGGSVCPEEVEPEQGTRVG